MAHGVEDFRTGRRDPTKEHIAESLGEPGDATDFRRELRHGNRRILRVLAATSREHEASIGRKFSLIVVEQRHFNLTRRLAPCTADEFVEQRLRQPVEKFTRASALFRRSASWTVFVVRQGQAQLREVEIGHRNTTEAEALRGIAAGDQVILHPTNEIRDGIRVSSR